MAVPRNSEAPTRIAINIAKLPELVQRASILMHRVAPQCAVKGPGHR